MRFLKTVVLSTSMALFASIPMAASATEIECLLRDERSTGGWIPLLTRITYDSETKEAVARYRWWGGEVVESAGQINLENDKRINFEFMSANIKDSQGQWGRIRYDVNVYKKDLSTRVTAYPLGYINRFKGRGKCRPVSPGS